MLSSEFLFPSLVEAHTINVRDWTLNKVHVAFWYTVNHNRLSLYQRILVQEDLFQWTTAFVKFQQILLLCGLTLQVNIHDTLVLLKVFYLSPVTRKPVTKGCDQVRLKPGGSATETSQSLGILDEETRDIILSMQRITKTLIRLRICAG